MNHILKIILALLLTGSVLPACRNTKKQEIAAEQKQTFTCPMHPQIVQEEPGNCPICGMDLVPFDKSGTGNTLMLGPRQKALANITTIKAGEALFDGSRQLNGRLVLNPMNSETVSSRVAGRIENLYVRQTGINVGKGQALYRIYSEQLAALQQEYLVSVAQLEAFPQDARFREIARAARHKLKLYGQAESQINRLRATRSQDPYVTYYAETAGNIIELLATEGQYVAEGTAILRLENYSTLWVEADVYPGENADIREGMKVQVIVPGWENQPQKTTIEFINPAFMEGSQTVQARATIANRGNQWRPGLQARILIPSGGRTSVMSLPTEAVIREESGAHVWIERDSIYEARKVTLGAEDFNRVEITSGLSAGDKVVVSGAYLLYSEFILKKGKNPVAVHEH